MLRARDFYDLASGRRRGLWPSLLRAGLTVAEGPYALAVGMRNRRYDRGSAAVHRVEVPVISVGNITVGGTGKTPMVKWIARTLREQEIRVSIVSRGYGMQNAGANDEALELELDLPDVPHVQNADRVAAARLAIDELATQAIVLDDGFQHRRIARDLDIVLLDATEPFGFGHLLPRGALRETLRGLKRAQVICLTRANLINEQSRAEIRERALHYATAATWCEASHTPTYFVNYSGESSALAALAGQRVLAFCGIGNPGAFQQTLAGIGVTPTAVVEYADHHSYTREDVEHLTRLAQTEQATAIVCTKKDLVKLGVDQLGDTRLWALAIEMQLTAGEHELRQQLHHVTAKIGDDPWGEE